ncbi:MAG TPA: alkaline phosphatase family protein [Acidimicrobiales bacterium]|nr:alkaline phosphatase family protein [Acidimicrobiales bacterium]
MSLSGGRDEGPAPAPGGAPQTPAVLPDYSAANLTGVVPGLLAPPGERPQWLPGPALDAGRAVLVVLDGLGWYQLQERAGLAPTLASMTGGPITTVAPSTTACALTSLVVGAPPAAHGVVGYRVVVPGPAGPEVMNVLKWKASVSGDARPFVDPAGFQTLPPFGGRPVPVVSKADFAGTPFTEAHQHGARQVGWYSPSGLAVDVRSQIAGGEPFVYAYYDGIDRVAHMQGFGAHYDAELTAVDRLVADVLDAVPPDVAVVVTADHGQVQVGSQVVELAPEVMARVALVSGEPRFRWLHTPTGAPGEAKELAELLVELYGDSAWVATYDQVEAEGWLGGPVGPVIRARLGDVALVPFAPVAYLEPGEAAGNRLLCRHGSLTAAEMFVPLLAGRGRRAD